MENYLLLGDKVWNDDNNNMYESLLTMKGTIELVTTVIALCFARHIGVVFLLW